VLGAQLSGTDLTIRDNVAGDDAGGLYLESAGGGIDGLDASDNVAGDDGGGVHAELASLTMGSLVLAGNAAGDDGGGAYLESSTATLTHATIAGNSCGYDGGGVQLIDSNLALTHGHVLLNQAINDGGGICVESSQLAAAHVTWLANLADDDGGGLMLDSGNASLDSCVLSSNVAASHGGGVQCDTCSLAVGHTAAWANSPTAYEGVADPTGVDGNLSANPGFLNTWPADPLDWNLHLSAGSALVDAGTPLEVDPDGGPADIGGYGGPDADGWDRDRDGYPVWWQPGPYDSLLYPALGLDCDDGDPTVFPGSGC